MVGRKLDRYRHKYKVLLVGTAALLLAETGEFFVPNDTLHKADSHTKSAISLEIPEHIPEKEKEKFSRHCQVCYRDSSDRDREKCVDLEVSLSS